MSLNDTLLANNMLQKMRLVIKSRYKNAIKMPFQDVITKALAKGFVQSVLTAKGVGLTPEHPAAGSSVGIGGVTSDQMTDFAKEYYLRNVGSIGEAFDIIIKSWFDCTVDHLKLTTNIPISGSGGPISKIIDITEDIVYNNIFVNLPEENQREMSRSKTGTILIHAMAHGFNQALTTTGNATPLPTVGGSTGIAVVSFK